jgi:L-amino acid N-acyltransferase YncA
LNGEEARLDLTIREAVVEDAAAVIAVLNPIIAAEPVAFDEPLTEANERDYIRTLSERGVFHVALLAGDVVGLQSLEPFATHTHLFGHVGVLGTYVAAAHRRCGIAGRLLAATDAAARSKGYEKLFTYVRADNPAALAAYEALGFRVVGRAERQLKTRNRYVDEIIVERFL